MLKVIVSCVLTGIISIATSYFINVYLGKIREKNKLVYDQLKDYSEKLSLLDEKWTEFDEIMRNWNNERDMSVAPIFWKKCLFKMDDIEKCFADYRASIHRTENVISNNFSDEDVFLDSVYSMSVTKSDDFNEANFFNQSKNHFEGHVKGKDDFPDKEIAYETMNKIYGTYVEIYKYRVKVKLSRANSYIDQKLQIVSNSISTHKFNKSKTTID